MEEPEKRINDICVEHGWDWLFTSDVGREYAWSGTLTVVIQPNESGRADRSFTTHSVGGGSAEECFAKACDEMIEWLHVWMAAWS